MNLVIGIFNFIHCMGESVILVFFYSSEIKKLMAAEAVRPTVTAPILAKASVAAASLL